MTRLFGTDGIRGIANVDLKPTLAFALGRATASHLLGGNGQLLVGQDTRRSGDMLVAGTRVRRDVDGRGRASPGRLPHAGTRRSSPATWSTVPGIMVSASHNPADDNGLKVLDARGLKLDDQSEEDARGAPVARRRAAQPDQLRASAARWMAGRGSTDTAQHRLSLARRAPTDLRGHPRLRQRVRR